MVRIVQKNSAENEKNYTEPFSALAAWAMHLINSFRPVEIIGDRTCSTSTRIISTKEMLNSRRVGGRPTRVAQRGMDLIDLKLRGASAKVVSLED